MIPRYAPGEGRTFGPTNYDNPHTPLHDQEQKRNAARRAGEIASQRQEPVEWDADRAITGLKRILGEVYS